jgi:multidrug efflux pump subunit AcrA (membrane-fusion protein)
MRLLLLNTAMLILVAACSSKPSKTPLVEQVQIVRVANAVTALAGTRLDVTGTVRLKREVALAFNTGGRIAALNINEGDSVRPGQVLAKLDRTSLQAAVGDFRRRHRSNTRGARR